jgi:hypothetical protein
MEARDLMLTKYGITHDQWNAAVQAMCVSGEYQYRHETKTTAGYNGGQSYTAYTYIKSGGYTPTGPNFAEALLLNDNSDVAIGCKAIAQMRIDTVTDFVKLMKENAGDKLRRLPSCPRPWRMRASGVPTASLPSTWLPMWTILPP